MSSTDFHHSASDGGETQGASKQEDGARRQRPTDREAARIGLRPVDAFVRAEIFECATAAKSKSKATEKKQRQREKQKAERKSQYNVLVPMDDPTVKTTVKAVADAAFHDRDLYSKVVAIVGDESLRDLVGAALTESATASLLAELGRRADLKNLARAAAADPKLAEAMSALAEAKVELSACMVKIVRATQGAAADGLQTALMENVTLGALRHPEAVARFLAVRGKGGARAKILRWILAA